MSFSDVVAAAANAGYLVSTSYARSLGVPSNELARLRRRGDVVLVRPQTWLVPPHPQWIDELVEEVTRCRATVSGASAAVLYGVPVLGWTGTCSLTVGRDRSRVSSAFDVHRADLAPSDIRRLRLQVGDRSIVLPVTSPSRLGNDLARRETLEPAVAAVDCLLRFGLLRYDEVVELRRGLWGRDAARVRKVLGLADPRAGSVLESLFRVLVVLAGMPPTQTQKLLTCGDGRRLGRVDFWYSPRLVVETEGDLFHGPDRLAVDEWRANELTKLGLELLRFCWAHVVGDPAYVLRTLAEVLGA